MRFGVNLQPTHVVFQLTRFRTRLARVVTSFHPCSMNTRAKEFPSFVAKLPLASRNAQIGKSKTGKKLTLSDTAESADPLRTLRNLAKRQRVQYEPTWSANRLAHALLVASGIAPAQTGITLSRFLASRMKVYRAKERKRAAPAAAVQGAPGIVERVSAKVAARLRKRGMEATAATGKVGWARLGGPAVEYLSPSPKDARARLTGLSSSDEDAGTDGDGVSGEEGAGAGDLSGGDSEGEFVGAVASQPPPAKKRKPAAPAPPTGGGHPTDVASELLAFRLESEQREQRLVRMMQALADKIAQPTTQRTGRAASVPAVGGRPNPDGEDEEYEVVSELDEEPREEAANRPEPKYKVQWGAWPCSTSVKM